MFLIWNQAAVLISCATTIALSIIRSSRFTTTLKLNDSQDDLELPTFCSDVGKGTNPEPARRSGRLSRGHAATPTPIPLSPNAVNGHRYVHHPPQQAAYPMHGHMGHVSYPPNHYPVPAPVPMTPQEKTSTIEITEVRDDAAKTNTSTTKTSSAMFSSEEQSAGHSDEHDAGHHEGQDANATVDAPPTKTESEGRVVQSFTIEDPENGSPISTPGPDYIQRATDSRFFMEEQNHSAQPDAELSTEITDTVNNPLYPPTVQNAVHRSASLKNLEEQNHQ